MYEYVKLAYSEDIPLRPLGVIIMTHMSANVIKGKMMAILVFFIIFFHSKDPRKIELS